MAVYQPNIPTGTIPLSIDYGNLQGNFQTLNTYFGRDHVLFSDNSSTSGYHKAVHLLDNVGNPAAIASTGITYSKSVNDSIATDQTLFYLASANNFISRMTMNFQPVSLANGYTFLPGNDTNGVMIQWGIKAIAASGTSTPVLFVTSNKNFPNNCFSVQLTGINNQGDSPSANSAFVKSGSVSKLGFTITNSSSSSTQSVYWVAIGN